MRLTRLILSTLCAAFATAQLDAISTLPSCAQTCLIKSLSTTTCLPTDLACLCKDEKFFATVAACNAGACSVIEQLDATNKTFALCQIPVHSQRNTLMGVGLSFGIFAVVMISLRLLFRGFSQRAVFGWDDILIAISGVVAMGMYGTSIAATVLGFGRDTWAISPDNITAIQKQLYAGYICFMLAEALCQLSILAFYLRIMVDRRLRLAVMILGGVVAAFGTANTFSMIFYCVPIRGFWEGWKLEHPGAYKCIDVHTYAFIRGGIQIFFDLAILSLPLPVVAKLQMDRRKKLQIMSMFCVGFVITVVSCLRLWAFIKFAKTHNPMYDNSAGLYWSGIECSLYQVVACMPAIPGIVRAVINPVRTLMSTEKSSSHGQTFYDSKNSNSRRSDRARDYEEVDSLELRIVTKSDGYQRS